jgi:hypothetical protein
MFKAWTSSAANGESLARDLEAHLNEHADEVISVSYAVETDHYVLAVYRPVDSGGQEEAAVAYAEHIIDEAHA